MQAAVTISFFVLLIFLTVAGLIIYHAAYHARIDSLDNAQDETSVMAGSFVSKEYGGEDEFYYVTENGAKYHTSDCDIIKNRENLYEISANTALYGGYTPCRKCVGN